MKKFNWFFSFCYLLFSIYLIVTTFVQPTLINILSLCLIVVILAIFNKFKNKVVLNKWLKILLLVLPIILRIVLFFTDYKNIASDYEFFYVNASNFVLGKAIDVTYVSYFPYLYAYIYSLGNFMKVFSTSYNSVIAFNLIIELLGGLLFYLICKKYLKKENLYKASLFWLYNPFNILWITKCCPVIIVNTLLLLVFYIFVLLKERQDIYKYLLAILLGILMSLTNNFRPILIIFLIAINIYYFANIIKTKKLKENLLIIFLITLSFSSINNLSLKFISNEINRDVPSSSGGWSIYVGSNYKSTGMWNAEDSAVLSYYEELYSPSNIHPVLSSLGIDRYKELGLKTIPFLMKKSVVLSGRFNTYIYENVFECIISDINSHLLLKYIISLFWYLILILNLISAFKIFKSKNDDNLLLPIGIFALGLYASTLLVEVSPRYFLPVLIPLIIMVSYIFNDTKI